MQTRPRAIEPLAWQAHSADRQAVHTLRSLASMTTKIAEREEISPEAPEFPVEPMTRPGSMHARSGGPWEHCRVRVSLCVHGVVGHRLHAIAYGRRVRAMLAAAVEGFNPSTARRLARVSRNAWALPLACAVVDDWGLGSGLCMGEEET
jgi:hypothetical protein